jgi:hypothetical protein
MHDYLTEKAQVLTCCRWAYGGRIIIPEVPLEDVRKDWGLSISDFSRVGSERGSTLLTDPITLSQEMVRRIFDMKLSQDDEIYPVWRPFVSKNSDQLIFPSLAKYNGYMLDDHRIVGYQVRLVPRCIIPFTEYPTSGESGGENKMRYCNWTSHASRSRWLVLPTATRHHITPLCRA